MNQAVCCRDYSVIGIEFDTPAVAIHMPEEPQLPVDEILVLDCQTGSVPALEHLVSRWQKRLWRHAYSLTGDADGAWDVT